MIKNNQITKKTYGLEARRRVFLVLAIISIVLFSVNFVSATTTVTLNSPPNYLNNSLNIVNFICSGSTDSGYLNNVSLWTNSTGTWHRNETVNELNYLSNFTNTTTQSLSYVLVKNTTIPGNGIVLNYTNKVWESSGGSSIYLTYTYANGTSVNTSVQVESSSTPTQHIWTSPFLYNLTAYIEVWMKTVNLGGVRINEGFDNITYNPISDTKTFIYNLTGYTLWNCEVCTNTTCSFAPSNYSVNYNLKENSRTVPTSASQGSTQTFTLNLTATDAVTSAYLNYNGTRYSTSITAGAFTIISTSMVIPAVTADGSATIFWELFTTYGGVNSSSSTMTVATSSVDNCATNKIYIYNFTIRGEDNQAVLNDTTGKVNVQIYSFDRATLITNYSTSQTANHIALCINSTFGATEKFSIDAEVEYSATNYQTEFYNIQNETLQNSYLYQNISLYDLNSTLAKVFKIIYKDSGYKAVEDAIIKVYRKYSGDINTWKISEIPITDYNGETTASLVENNVIYSFYVYKYGTLLSSFENVFVKCQYSSIDQCTLYLNDFSSVIDIEDLEDGEDFNFTLDYNSTSREILCTFNIPSGSSHLISLVVKTSDSLETSVCSDSITSSSGTLTCTVPNTFGNSTITAKIYKDGVFQSYGNIKLDQDSSSIYGGSLVLLGLLMLFSLIGASLSGNPVIMIVSFLVGIIALVSLNLISNNGFLGGTAAVLFLVIAIIIILIKVGRRN